MAPENKHGQPHEGGTARDNPSNESGSEDVSYSADYWKLLVTTFVINGAMKLILMAFKLYAASSISYVDYLKTFVSRYVPEGVPITPQGAHMGGNGANVELVDVDAGGNSSGSPDYLRPSESYAFGGSADSNSAYFSVECQLKYHRKTRT